MRIGTRTVRRTQTEVTLSGAELGRIVADHINRRMFFGRDPGQTVSVGLYDADRESVVELPELTVVVVRGPAEPPQSV